MPDVHREVTNVSWGSRLRSSLGGVLFGFVLFVAGLFLLFTNEGRAVRTAKSLAQGSGEVVSVAAGAVDAGMEGRLVHVSGPVETDEVLLDPLFGVERKGLRLRRGVEMYAWVERSESKTETKVGGGTETVTTYRYEKEWSGSPQDSGSFREAAGHENPPMPFRDETWTVGDAHVGAFRLGPGLLDGVGRFEEVRLSEAGDAPGPAAPEGFRVTADGRLYRGASAVQPQVGDLRVTYEVVPTQAASVVARQTGDGFSPYPTKAGKPILMVRTGTVPAATMFESAVRSNTVLTWILRLGGLLLLFVAVRMVLGPLAVLADVLPPVGVLTRMGTSFVAFLVAVPVGLVVIAVAWLFYRPALGIALLAVAAVGLVLLLRSMRKAKRSAPAATGVPGFVPPPPPPPGGGA